MAPGLMPFAEVVEGQWRPGIGDPTALGWATVAAYLVAAFGCGWAAWREPLPDGARRERPAMFWLVLAAMLTALGINKQLDLHSLVTVIGRRVLRTESLYQNRRVYQLAFILAVASACAGLVALFLWAARRTLRRRWLALVGMMLVLGFVVIRASSFHHVDEALAARPIGMQWTWILELGGIIAVGLAAFRIAWAAPPPSPRIRGRLTASGHFEPR